MLVYLAREWSGDSVEQLGTNQLHRGPSIVSRSYAGRAENWNQ